MANVESKSQLEPAGKNVVRSMPWLVALGQIKGRHSRKILIKSIAHDLAVVTDACRNSVGKLANCAQNHRRARAAGPKYRAHGGEAGIICVTNHVSRTIDGVTVEDDNAVNESASGEASATGVLVLFAQNTA